MSLVFYISGHGFGHAARSQQVMAAVARRAPDVRLVVRSTVPEWFLRAGLGVSFDIVAGETDTGVVQPDGLSIDADATAQRASTFYGAFERHVAAEAGFLRRFGARLVVSDIAPLAFAAARRVGIPSVAIGNFTWDWIYGGFPAFDRSAPGVRATIATANALATQTLRLPFAGGFDGMSNVEDIPLVARVASVPRRETRRRLQIPSDRPVVLATFGGHGGSIPLEHAAESGSLLVLATDYEVRSGTPAHRHIRVVPSHDLAARGLTYTDMLAACDVVVTKLGYGIVSECLANGVALLYTLRDHFIEQEVFMREMPSVMRCRRIEADDLRRGHWAEGVHALLAQPVPRTVPAPAGATVAADRIVARL